MMGRIGQERFGIARMASFLDQTGPMAVGDAFAADCLAHHHTSRARACQDLVRKSRRKWAHS